MAQERGGSAETPNSFSQTSGGKFGERKRDPDILDEKTSTSEARKRQRNVSSADLRVQLVDPDFVFCLFVLF